MLNSKKTDQIKYISEEQKKRTEIWFKNLRDHLCEMIENIENTKKKEKNQTRFELTPWTRIDKINTKNKDTGGGVMGLMRDGDIFEKAAIHISTIKGIMNPEMIRKFAHMDIKQKNKKQKFWSTGISVIIHPRNPNIPTAHMNTRLFDAGKWWFGGGADLTPMIQIQRDPELPQSKDFIRAMTSICIKHSAENAEKYKKWCDQYFFLPHRNEMRGIGGIFYDYHNSGDWEKDFDFTRDVGKTFAKIYEKIIRQNINKKWTQKQKNEQLIQRGRYAEFNLLYDRGTRFGLDVGGNIEAILSSLPPLAKWP